MNKIYQLYRQHEGKALTFADQALVSGSNFITSLIYAKLLGLESYGVFVLGWMIILFTSTFQQAFIFNPMANINAALLDAQKKYYLNQLFHINLIFSLCSTLLIALFTFIMNNFFHTTYMKDMLYLIPVAAFAFLNYDFFRKRMLLLNHVKTALLLDTLFILLQSLFICYLYYSQYITIYSIILSIAASYSMTCIVAYFLSSYITLLPTINFIILREHWRQGKWLVATSIVQWFSGNYFIIAAAGILGTRDIGIIRIAQNIVGIMNILFIAMESYIPISASKLFHKHGKTSLFDYLKSVTIKGLTLTSLICFSIILFSDLIVRLLYGEEFVAYSFVVQLFALFYILVFTAIPLRFAIKTLEQNHHIFVGYLLSATFSVLFAASLIKQHGIYGVIIGIFATQLLTQLWYIFSLKTHLYEYYSFSTRKS